jgi:hypothetical protein
MMDSFDAKGRVVFLLLLSGFLFQSPSASAHKQGAKRVPQPGITAEEAQALEEGLKTNPDNQAAQEKLIDYYFVTALTSRAPDLEVKREEHIFWIIEHHPESELAGSPEADIQPIGSSQGTEGYQRGKQLWLTQVEKYPDNLKVIRNAAEFVTLWDMPLGRELLEKALRLDPNDSVASSALAQSYMQERMVAESSEEKVALAAKALSIRERTFESSKGTPRFYELGEIADEAYEAGNLAKVQQYASELLDVASQFRGDWNYGNALHKGNIVLGRIALQQGDIPTAEQHLLAAGETPGSPQLDSFGPNMTLAKELLEKGERDAVLTYLQSCAKFWKMDDGQLQNWMSTVKAGGVPDFGANLVY